MKEICLIGLPSYLGGADTECFAQIILWRMMGLNVYILPHCLLDSNAIRVKNELEKKGIIYMNPMDWSQCDGLDVISYCNGDFLTNLPEIRKYARSTTFVNCMCYNFKMEIQRQAENLIDLHLYQTKHQFEKVSPALRHIGNVYRSMFVKPYFDISRFIFWGNRPTDKFRFGRLSRGDADKYGSDQLWIWETMCSPVLKSGICLGWDDRARNFFGRDLPSFVKGYRECEISQERFYEFVSCLIMQTKTFENLPRVAFEAIASGSLLIVDNRGGWKELVEHKKTGYLCDNEREFVYYSTRAAFEIDETNDMRFVARKRLESEWSKQKSIDSWEQIFNELRLL